MNSQGRIFGLDLLRAVAIIHVVIQHGGSILEGTFLEGFPFFSMIDGVDIFFALSGYLIGKILLREINQAQLFSFKDLLVFWKRRWLRTLPNYYLILLANYLVVKYGIIVEYISEFNWKFFFFLQNFNKPFAGFFWESWTLSIEEWFYIFAPLLLLLCLRFFKPKAAFITVTLIMLLAPMLHRMSIYNPQLDYSEWSEVYRKLVVNRLDSIAYGLLGAWLFYYYNASWNKLRYPGLLISLGLNYFIFHYPTPATSFYAQVFLFTVSSISAFLLLPLGENLRQGRGFFARAVTHISLISYSMYLINGALVAEVIRDNFPPTTPGDRLLKYGLYWLAVILFSTLLYYGFERPVLKLRDRKKKANDLSTSRTERDSASN